MLPNRQYSIPLAYRHINTKTFADLFARRWQLQKGEVAVEFELEGKGNSNARNRGAALAEPFLKPDGQIAQPFFNYHKDNSLDALRGFEMVYASPVDRFKAFEENIKLFQQLPELDNSIRCSTHVHLNVQKWTLQQLGLFATLYYIYENAFFKVHGIEREGSIFCLRLDDCPAIVDNYRDMMTNGRFSGRACNEEWRYASLNLAALKKFGSLELRSHRAVNNGVDVNNWIKALLDLYDYVRVNKYQKPSDLMYVTSREGIENFTRRSFPDLYRYIQGVPNLQEELGAGVWRAQDIAFCVNWEPAKEGQEVQPAAAAWGDLEDGPPEIRLADAVRAAAQMRVKPARQIFANIPGGNNA